ncbi:MAG: hypothetical protein QG597_3679, partial [Actinomycetota bacterium]|nr:hypothetical protein [Actinomycetota bacterium]
PIPTNGIVLYMLSVVEIPGPMAVRCG